MNEYAATAQRLTDDLRLSLPPIAVCFTDSPPASVPRYNGPTLPAGCVFWQEAAQGAFATAPSDHRLCAIGMYTHNLETTPADDADRDDALKVFAELGYLKPDQIADVPVLQTRPRQVVYAPLAESPLPPDVVLLFVEADQALILSEASQSVDEGVPPAMGRPACGVVPAVQNSGRAALSLGCCGARAYLDKLSPSVALWALPGPRLAEYSEQITQLSRANATLTRFHEIRRNDVAAGATPTVKQSLERMEAEA